MLVPESILVPEAAYTYDPPPNIVFHGKGKKAQRFVFAHQKFSDFESDKLARLELELQRLKINPYQTHPFWSRSDLLRFCYGTGWKTRVATKVLTSYLKWYNNTMPQGYLPLYPKAENILNTGCLYVHGRDMYYRPIIVIDLPKFDFKKHPVQEYIYFIAFFLEYIKENMLMPGRIENWVLVTDMGHKGLGPSNLSNLKQVLKVLTDNYRCRLGVNYILNPPKTVFFIWSCIKPFMDDVLIEKMKIINNSYSAELLTHANPLHVEMKFGGKAENVVEFWPPFVPNEPFLLESEVSENSNRKLLIHIFPVEPSEISLADTKLTHSIRIVPEAANEKHLGCCKESDVEVSQDMRKKEEKNRKKDRKERKRRRKEKRIKKLNRLEELGDERDVEGNEIVAEARIEEVVEEFRWDQGLEVGDEVKMDGEEKEVEVAQTFVLEEGLQYSISESKMSENPDIPIELQEESTHVYTGCSFCSSIKLPSHSCIVF